MNTNRLSNLSRRHFISAGLGAGALIQAPRRLFAEETGIVPTMIQAASQAEIEVHPLRRNISVLEGSGGKHRRTHRQGWQASHRRRIYSLETTNLGGP